MLFYIIPYRYSHLITLRLIFFLLFVFLAISVQAQKPKLQFKHLSTEEGLSHDFARKITQDHRGYMWIATKNGLNRFDGLNVAGYKNKIGDNTSLSSSDVYSVLEDSRKNLWVGTTEGLNLYNRFSDNFKRYNVQGARLIEHLYEDAKKDLWLTSGSKIFRFDPAKKEFQQVKFKGFNDAVTTLYEDASGNFWIGGYSGLWLVNREEGTARRINEVAYWVTGICEDSRKDFWFTTRSNGLFLLDRKTYLTENFSENPADKDAIPSNVLLTIDEDFQGNLWLGSERTGLIVFNPQSRRFFTYTGNPFDSESIKSNSVYSIYCGKHGDMWVTTYDGGVEFVAALRFRHIKSNPTDPKSISSNKIISLYEDKKGSFWVGTDGEGLNHYDLKTGTATRFRHRPGDPSSLSNNVVNYIAEDADRNLWIGHWDGGLSKMISRDRYENIGGVPDNKITTMFTDRAGRFWIGTSSGLSLLNPRTKASKPFYFPVDRQPLVSDILEAGNHNFWVATFNGLFLLDRKTEKTEAFFHDESRPGSISNSTVHSLYEDSKGRMWVGTGAGLNLYRPYNKTFTAFVVKGKESEQVFRILEDKKNNLWLSTSNGIWKFNPATKTFKTYDIGDGLQGKSFSEHAFVKLRSGEMAFGGNNGFNIFRPEEIIDNPTPPAVTLTDFKIFNRSVLPRTDGSSLKNTISETKELMLSYEASVISFDFSTINYISPEKNRFAYQLEGFDKDWNYVGSKRTATYTNLDPGTYYFKVKAANSDGIWNERGTNLKLIITPPLWRTWWFRILSALTLIGIISSAYVLRIRGLKKQQLLLEMMVQSRTEEIVSQNEQLIEQQDELKTKDEELLNQIGIIRKVADKVSEGNYSIRIQEEDEKSVLGGLSFTLNRMAASLEESFKKNEELMNKKDEFLSIASHELKTPLTSIKAAIQFIDRITFNNEETRKIYPFIAKANSQVNRLTEIVRDLLDVSKINAGKLELNVSEFALSDAVTEAKHGIFDDSKDYEIVVTGDTDIIIKADKFRIEQVLINLITNAFKYSPGQKTVYIHTCKTEDLVKVAVEDRGIGIPKDKIPFIFERFFRVQETSQNFPGLGLGLYISFEIVKRHGGEMGVDSKEGEGSTFWFTLPVIS